MDLQTPADMVRHPLAGLSSADDAPRAESQRRPPPDFVDFKEPDYKDVIDRPDRPDITDIVDIRDVRDIKDIRDFPDAPDIIEQQQ